MSYVSFSEKMRKRFGGKVYRLSLSSGCTCPNRDGKCGWGGCIFCSGEGSGDFAASSLKSTDEQIEEAKRLVESKVAGAKDRGEFAGYIAYFQSFSNTYGDVEKLEKIYTDVIARPEILALSLGTRPDCLDDEVMDMLIRLNKIKPVWIELGLQTIHDRTAKLINRGYTLDVYDDAVKKLKEAGIEFIVHIIIGLPGETESDILKTVKYVCDSGTDGIKLQVLQILKDTRLAEMYEKDPNIVKVYTLCEYSDIIDKILAIVPERVTIHRITGDPPKSLLIEPKWTADKKRVLNRLVNGR